MSLIARCPACKTLFRVVPDQLKISDGWVRCGQCSEVFDAPQNLRVDPGQEPVPEPIQAPIQAPEAAPAAPFAGPTELADPPEALKAQLPADPCDTPTDPGEPEPEAVPAPDIHPADRALDLPAGEPEPDEPPLDDIAFVRQAHRRAWWQRPDVRWGLIGLSGSLGLLLATQIVFHHRDRIVQEVPVVRPLFAALCAALECRLGLPQRIEAIAIDSSAFIRLQADAYRLNLTLSNRAPIDLAMPALELTLTDLQGQPVVRRVLQPAELGPDTPRAIGAHDEWASVLTISLTPAPGNSRIVGYRLLAFYP